MNNMEKLEKNDLINGVRMPIILIVYIFGMMFLGINTYLSYLVYAFLALLFMISPLEYALPMYVALFPWERCLTIPILGSFSTVIQFLFLFKLVYHRLSTMRIIGLAKLFFFLIYAALSLLLYRNISSLGLLLDVLIAAIAMNKIIDKEYNEIGLTIVTYISSTISSIIYGIIHGLFIGRWIDGLGTITVLNGVQGANETGFCINIALLLLLIWPTTFKKKMLGISILGVFIALTLSFTSIAIYVFIIILSLMWDIIRFRNYTISRKYKFRLITIMLILFIVFLSSQIGDSLLHRISNMVIYFQEGNYSKLTSNRNDLLEVYLSEFRNLPFFNQLLGTFSFSKDYLMSVGTTIGYSHNTVIDILYYSGVVGLFVQLVLSFSLICSTLAHRKELSLLKIIVIIEMFSLSIYDSSFWFFWFVL